MNTDSSKTDEVFGSVQQKYAEERDKRLREDGNSQYIDLSTSERYGHFTADPWAKSEGKIGKGGLKNGSKIRVLILGAGIGGLLFAVRLIQAGFKAEDICLVDEAGGFGGVWYWNRYPGLMCDVESYTYLPLLEETDFIPKHRYSYGQEIRQHINTIAEKWNLVDRGMFGTCMEGLTWNDETHEWTVKLKQGDSLITVYSQFVISTSGLLCYPKLPKLRAMDEFEGHSFHTSRWDYAYTGGSQEEPNLTKLKGKRVGIIGTGATGIQVIPELAKWADHLYVFQRTPSAVDTRGQRSTDIEWWKREVGNKKGCQKERRHNFDSHITNYDPPNVNLVNDSWVAMNSYRALVGGLPAPSLEQIPAYLGELHALDFVRQERLRTRVDEIVKDKNTAEKLKAWYPGWCKRPTFHDEYLNAFNKQNVTLVDTAGKGIDGLTKRAVLYNGTEYPVDVLIFSTGFRSPSAGVLGNIEVVGRGGITLTEKTNKAIASLHGCCTHDFPNYFFPGPYQAAASPNYSGVLDEIATHVAYIVSQSVKKAEDAGENKDRLAIEPSVSAEEAWTIKVMSGATIFAALAGCTPSYINGEGAFDKIKSSEDQLKAARLAPWGEGMIGYLKILEAWRDKGDMEGIEVKF